MSDLAKIREEISSIRIQLDQQMLIQSNHEIRWIKVQKAVEGVRFYLGILFVLVVAVPALFEVLKWNSP